MIRRILLLIQQKLKLWWYALYKVVKAETERLAHQEAGGQACEQEKTMDSTRAKMVHDFLKKEMEYVRMLKTFEKVCL